MIVLDPKRFGLAFASATGLFYLGCAVLMALAGPETLAVFFNGLLHGLDLRPVLVHAVDPWVSLSGFINTVVLSWLFGALIAVIYNVSARGTKGARS